MSADANKTHAQQLKLSAEHHTGNGVAIDNTDQGADEERTLKHGHAEDTVIDLAKTGNQRHQKSFDYHSDCSFLSFLLIGSLAQIGLQINRFIGRRGKILDRDACIGDTQQRRNIFISKVLFKF